MEWSRSPSRSRGVRRGGRPPLPPSRRRTAAWGEGAERRFRIMVALSGGLHVAAFLAALAVDSLHRRIVLPETVAVVDLVGAPAPPEERAAPAPAAAAPRPPAPRELPRSAPAKAAPAPKAEAPPRAAPPQKAPPAAPAHASPDGLLPPARPAAPAKAPPPPDARGAEEAIRRIREAQAHSENVRGAAERLRLEREAASAIGRVRERAARTVDLSSLRPAAKGAAPRGPSGAAATGAVGNVRATLEQVEYFRALDERVRANWIAPPGDHRSQMVQVVVTIEKNGSVSDVKVEKGSGSPFFDESVLRAIRKASPLPVPPERLRGGEECYSVGFRFYGAGGGEA